MALHRNPLIIAVFAAGLLAGCGNSPSTSASSTTVSSTSSIAPITAPGNGSAGANLNPDQPLALIGNLTGLDTEIAFGSPFRSALTTLNVTPSPLGSASFVNGTLTLPITGGRLAYYVPNGPVQPFVQGVIHHLGSGLALTAAGARVELTNFDLDPAAAKLYADVAVNGTRAAPHASLFHLDEAAWTTLHTPTPDTAVLDGAKVELTPDAAQLLDAVFHRATLAADLVVGTATLILATG